MRGLVAYPSWLSWINRHRPLSLPSLMFTKFRDTALVTKDKPMRWALYYFFPHFLSEAALGAFLVVMILIIISLRGASSFRLATLKPKAEVRQLREYLHFVVHGGWVVVAVPGGGSAAWSSILLFLFLFFEGNGRILWSVPKGDTRVRKLENWG